MKPVDSKQECSSAWEPVFSLLDAWSSAQMFPVTPETEGSSKKLWFIFRPLGEYNETGGIVSRLQTV